MRHPQQPVRITFDPRKRSRFRVRINGALVPGTIKKGQIHLIRSVARALGIARDPRSVMTRLLR